MTVKCGKDHVFVGMDISFIDDHKVRVTMKSYLKEAIRALGKMCPWAQPPLQQGPYSK